MTEAAGHIFFGASIAVFRDDTVLLVRRVAEPFAGLWSLPGGKVRDGETADATALRELAEEAGIEAVIAGISGSLQVAPPSATATYVLTVFAGRHVSGTPLAASDAAEARWVRLDALASLALTPDAEPAIRAAHALVVARPA